MIFTKATSSIHFAHHNIAVRDIAAPPNSANWDFNRCMPIGDTFLTARSLWSWVAKNDTDHFSAFILLLVFAVTMFTRLPDCDKQTCRRTPVSFHVKLEICYLQREKYGDCTWILDEHLLCIMKLHHALWKSINKDGKRVKNREMKHLNLDFILLLSSTFPRLIPPTAYIVHDAVSW